MLSVILLILAVALVYFAWDLRRVAARKAGETGVAGNVLYSDADHSRPVEPLVCELPGGVRLTGKPDYLMKRDGKVVPLEYKSSKSPGRLFQNHEDQVGAYFILIEAKYGQAAAPPHGIVRFSDGNEFDVANTPKLRERVVRNAMLMHNISAGIAKAERNHRSPAKCAACEFFSVCDERL